MTISANYPSVIPSLSLDFANSGVLDNRITFTRSTTGTYYNGYSSAVAEQNLLVYSQDFTNANWVKGDVTVVGNSTTAPDGTTTACTLTATTSVNGVIRELVTYNGSAYTFSVWLKRLTGTGNIQINAGGSYTTVAVTSSWALYTITQTPSAGVSTTGIFITTNTDAVYAWGAQLEQRSAVTAYTPTTTTAITNYIPVLQTGAINQARFDHDPVLGTSLGLLIEQQSTNLLTYSADFSNAAWTKTASSITSAANIAPDGTQTGSKLVANSTSTTHYVSQTITSQAASWTYSVYAKAGEYNRLVLFANLPNYIGFNLSTGTVESTLGTGWTSASITAVGNGWYRCSGTSTSIATGTAVYISVFNASYTNGNTAPTFVGDGYSGIYIWGAQLE